MNYKGPFGRLGLTVCYDLRFPEVYQQLRFHRGAEVQKWLPRHIVAHDEDKTVLGVILLYLKSHSYVEYVFDHSWVDAYYRYGSRYYPELQCCVPFTPVPGPRILVCNTSYKDQVFDILVYAMKDLAIKFQVSSLHITFSSKREWNALKDKGFLQRPAMQYHWKNRNYKKYLKRIFTML